MKKVKKPSPKKGDPAQIASKYLLEVEHKQKIVALDVEGWTKNLASVSNDLQMFGQMIEKKMPLTLGEINKNFSKTKSLLAKISKALEAAQKSFAKMQAEFEEDFETPLSEGLFSAKDATILEVSRATVQKIHEVFSESMQSLSPLAHQCQDYHVRLGRLEDQFNTLFLPDQIQEATTQGEALNQRLESIYKTMASMAVDSAVREPTKLQESFLPLSTAYAQEGNWLQQIKSLSRPIPAGLVETIASVSAASPAPETDVILENNRPKV